MPQDLTDNKSTLVPVMSWCRQATSHYLDQCWPRSPMPYGDTRPQWVKEGFKKKTIYSCSDFPPSCIWQKHQQLINWQKHTFPSKLHNYNIGTLLNVEIAWLLHTWWAQRCMFKLSNRQYIPALKKSKTLDTKDFYSDILWYYTWGDFYRKCSRYLSLI